MPLRLKLVGTRLEIIDDFNGPLTLSMLEGVFELWSFNKEDFSKLMLITDSERMKDYDKQYMVNETEERIIFITTSEPLIKQKLQKVFENMGTDKSESKQPFLSESKKEVIDEEIIKPLKEEINEEFILTNEHVLSMNKKTVELFSDNDFKFLVKIYITKPELFSSLALFTQKGDMVEIKTEKCESNYENELAMIKEFNLNFSDELILEKLNQFNGHLNLTLRALLCDL